MGRGGSQQGNYRTKTVSKHHEINRLCFTGVSFLSWKRYLHSETKEGFLVFFFYKKPAFSQIEQKYLLDMGAGHEACNLCRSHNLFHF